MPTSLSTELEWMKWEEEDERLCHCQAIFLLDELDPNVWAMSANRTGVYIQPRDQVHGLTLWEKTLHKSGLKTPAVWTGYLSRSVHLGKLTSRKSFRTSSMWPEHSPRDRSSARVQAGVFSLSRLLTVMQESFLDGLHMEAESMREKYR